MASSERAHARRPLLVVALSLLVFAALDNGIFRSGLYAKVASDGSVAGHFAAVARRRLADPPSEKREVLVLGHSKINAALSERIFVEENPDSQLKLAFATSGGTTEKMWFYLLKHLDPQKRRYAAIIVPVDSYVTQPIGTDCENLIDVAQCVAPMLGYADWRDLISSYPDPKVRARVAMGAAFSSHLYAVDLQDLLLHPVDRYRSVTWAEANAPTFLYNFPGFDGDVETLEVNRDTAKIIHAPAHFDAFRRRETEVLFEKAPPEWRRIWTDRYHAFRSKWTRRIVDLYAGSSTKLVFVQVPRWPVFMPAITPIEGAPGLRDFVTPSENVVVMDEKQFEDLEAPKYFYDVLHVNKLARKEFSSRFGKSLRKVLADAP